jgi:cytochrome b6-f complex iron-sulfur subunit
VGGGKRGRRFFLFVLIGSWFALGWTSLVASLLGMGLGTIRFLFPNVLAEPPSKFKADPPDQFEPESVVTRYKDTQHTWIVRHHFEQQGDILYALDATCTHLGCTPNWLEREQKFKCPCHGSGFRITGVNYEGPAPRPLERVAVSIAEDGNLLIDKSKHFRQELGQWADPASFVKI